MIEKNHVYGSASNSGAHNPNGPFKLIVTVTEDVANWGHMQKVVASTQRSPLGFGFIVLKAPKHTPFEEQILACCEALDINKLLTHEILVTLQADVPILERVNSD